MLGRGLRHPGGGAALLQCLRPPPGALQSLHGRPPIIFEDGCQTRDFTHVRDIVQANVLAMERDTGPTAVLNVGTGCVTTIAEVLRVTQADNV